MKIINYSTVLALLAKEHLEKFSPWSFSPRLFIVTGERMKKTGERIVFAQLVILELQDDFIGVFWNQFEIKRIFFELM